MIDKFRGDFGSPSEGEFTVTHSPSVSRLIAPVFLIIVMSAAAAYAGGPEKSIMDLPDSALGEIAAQGITTGGNLSASCLTGSNALCLGTFELNDNHQFDNSNYKGAIEMSGYAQQYLSTEINVNQTQGASASGVNLLNSPSSLDNSTFELTNTNNATNFVGGF
jgi:hypothetical protein